MAQFECEICGVGFEQKSKHDRHMQTSHPQQAISAADIERALKGIDFPKCRDELAKAVTDDRDDSSKNDRREEVRDIIRQLPDRNYRDAAEVSRVFGELRTHEKAPDDQPSKTGGQRATEAPSAARLASLFEGMEFPVTRKELLRYANPTAREEDKKTLRAFTEKTYRDMVDIAKELGKVR